MKNIFLNYRTISSASAFASAFAFALVFAFVFASTFSSAQENTSGSVVYEQVVKLEIKLEGDAAQFADMLPKERRSDKVLYFNQNASLFENKAKEEDETMSMSFE